MKLYAAQFERFCSYYEPNPIEKATVVIEVDEDVEDILELAYEALWVQYPHWGNPIVPWDEEKGWSSALNRGLHEIKPR